MGLITRQIRNRRNSFLPFRVRNQRLMVVVQHFPVTGSELNAHPWLTLESQRVDALVVADVIAGVQRHINRAV